VQPAPPLHRPRQSQHYPALWLLSRTRSLCRSNLSPTMSLILNDLTGQRFHRLLVLAFYARSKKARDSLWRVRCDCGVEKIVARGKLLNGHTKSCGCLRKPHGMFGTPEYRAWDSMIQRCTNPKARGWERYGGRGISVCCAWMESFQVFFKYVGTRPSKQHSLDRFPDRDGNYAPGNVRWATAKEQQRNTSNNRYVKVGDLELTISAWAKRTGLLVSTIRERLCRGWSPNLAVSVPANRRRPHVMPRKPAAPKKVSRGKEAAQYAKEHSVTLADAGRCYGISRTAVQQQWHKLFGGTPPPARHS
jgi:hypothetical protein